MLKTRKNAPTVERTKQPRITKKKINKLIKENEKYKKEIKKCEKKVKDKIAADRKLSKELLTPLKPPKVRSKNPNAMTRAVKVTTKSKPITQKAVKIRKKKSTKSGSKTTKAKYTPKMRKTTKRAPSAYNIFVGVQMRKGKTMKEAIDMWRER